MIVLATTHKVPQENLVDPPEELEIGTDVTVYWNHSKKKFWKGEIAPSTAPSKKSGQCILPISESSK